MEKETIKKASFSLMFILGVIVAILVFANIEYAPEITKEYETFKPVHVYKPGEGNPGTGASGFLEIYFINLSSADSSGYGQNTTATFETWATANMPGKTPYGTADEFEWETESDKTFVILVRVRYNDTHAKDGANWFGTDTDVQLTMTCTAWTVGANIANASGTRYESSNTSGFTYLYENFVWDNSGTGYQIADDSTWAVTEIYIEAQF